MKIDFEIRLANEVYRRDQAEAQVRHEIASPYRTQRYFALRNEAHFEKESGTPVHYGGMGDITTHYSLLLYFAWFVDENAHIKKTRKPRNVKRIVRK